MKITSLVENTAKSNWPTEHGLSLYIETEGHRVLFDTGQGGLFAENSGRLGLPLESVDLCVLSHGHYDHGGGVRIFTGINDTAPVYMRRHAFGLYYDGEDQRYIGLPQEWLRDQELQGRIVYTDGDVRIDEELTILMPGTEKRIEMGSAGLCVKENGKLVPDRFLHEQYLMIEEHGKRVLISGCSHQGIVNIMEWFRPDVLIGGFHFMDEEPGEVLLRYGTMLAEYDADYYTCHCTGTRQYEFLKPAIARMRYLMEGESLTI